MASLLDVLLTFVGVMLVLSLASQSLQEMLKVMFAIKGQARRRALEGLLNQAAVAAGLQVQDATAIVTDVVNRLRGLGQRGFRPSAIRLDSLTPALLSELVKAVDSELVPSLKGIGQAAAGGRLGEVAQRAVTWFALSMDPVEDRYGRQMRGLALAAAAAVVLGVNADARYVLQQARGDPAYRAQVSAFAEPLARLEGRVRARQDSLRAITDTTDTAFVRLRGALRADGDSMTTVLHGIAPASASGFVIGKPGRREWANLGWWLGILFSTLLVSLGAPFWHDVLESVLGLKNRIRIA